MKIWEFTTDDVDELSTHLTKLGSDNKQMQLSAGKLGFRTSIVEMPGVRIRWNRFGQSLLFRQVIEGNGFNFGFLLQGSPPLRHSGNYIPAGQGIVQAPFSEHEYVNDKKTESLIVNVSMDIAKKMGWQFSSDVTHGVRVTIRNNLIHQCRKITAAAQCTTPIDRLAELELRDSLLDNLSIALQPWLTAEKKASKGGAKSGSYYVFRQAMKALSNNQSNTLSIPTLARYLKVSERTLYRSFDHWVGVGPYEFFTLCRLHAFRRQLLTGPLHRGKITRAAKTNGFEELSRLSQIYKRHFGELPSETLVKHRELIGN